MAERDPVIDAFSQQRLVAVFPYNFMQIEKLLGAAQQITKAAETSYDAAPGK